MAPQVGNEAHVTINVKIVGPIPANAMSLVLIFATPATIAFGGVPTGMWKAKQQLRAAKILIILLKLK